MHSGEKILKRLTQAFISILVILRTSLEKEGPDNIERVRLSILISTRHGVLN